MTDILAIVGSTRFACPDGPAIAEALIAAELATRRPDVVTSGGAACVDTLGEQAADRLGIAKEIHRPKVRRWAGPDGFQARNLLIATGCTRALRISCAHSRTYGSGWTGDRAAEMGKPVRRVVINADGTVIDSGWPDGPVTS